MPTSITPPEFRLEDRPWPDYIMYGPPIEVESHPLANLPAAHEEGGGQTSTFPFETWRYRYLEGIGQEVIIEFVDDCQCGAMK